MTLTDEQRDELQALRKTNDELGHASFSHRSQLGFYRPLIDAGLVEWGDPPLTFDPRTFAGATITAKGRDVLDAQKTER